MDWWKLFSGTFVLIFLAELGDKTQLAALAKTADAPDSAAAKWVVFLGASAALVLSTFVAVFLGHVLKALVPDERYIKAAAAILFLVFGAMMLREIALSFRAAPEAAAAAMPAGTAARPGIAGGLALAAAMDIEKSAGDRYRRLAETAAPALAAVLLELAREEDSHLAHLREFTPGECADGAWDSCEAPVPESAAAGAAGARPGDRRMLEDLVNHEESTALFYRSLAKKTLIPSVRNVLAHLAGEEEGHAERLRAFV